MPFLVAAWMVLFLAQVVVVCWSRVPLPEWLSPVRAGRLRYLMMAAAAETAAAATVLLAPEAFVILLLAATLGFPFYLIACGVR